MIRDFRISDPPLVCRHKELAFMWGSKDEMTRWSDAINDRDLGTIASLLKEKPRTGNSMDRGLHQDPAVCPQ